MSSKELGPSRALAAKTIHCAFKILKQHNCEMPYKDLLKRIEEELEFNDWEKTIREDGKPRWQVVFVFFSINCVKTGFLIKKSGVWYLTPEGVAVTSKNQDELLEIVNDGYKKWLKNKQLEGGDPPGDGVFPPKTGGLLLLNEIQDKAMDGMIEFIDGKNPYEFQELVAALLRGMGYYTPFVAPKGKDGGVDITAYKDPLGITTPRIRVQVKHRETPASAPEIRELRGLLKQDGDVGLFVSTGGFTPDGKSEARTSGIHVELIDQRRFIELWQKLYNKLSDVDKKLFPLRSVYILDVDGI